MMLKKKRGYIGIPTVLVLAVLLSLLSPMALATSLTDTISGASSHLLTKRTLFVYNNMYSDKKWGLSYDKTMPFPRGHH